MGTTVDGNITNGRPMVQLLRQMARFHDVEELDISGEAGDVVVGTKWPGYDVVQVYNKNATVADFIVKTVAGGGATATAVTIPVDSYQCCAFVLPPIHTIVKTGTDDNLLVLLQKK